MNRKHLFLPTMRCASNAGHECQFGKIPSAGLMLIDVASAVMTKERSKDSLKEGDWI
jgi:hypothetical protein